jgi:hypothetical protein
MTYKEFGAAIKPLLSVMIAAVCAGGVVGLGMSMAIKDAQAQGTPGSYERALRTIQASNIDRFPSTNRCKVGSMWIDCQPAEASPKPATINEAPHSTVLTYLNDQELPSPVAPPHVRLDIVETSEVCLFVARTGQGNISSVAMAAVLKKDLRSGKCK